MLLDPGCSLFPRTWVKNRRRIPSIKNVIKPTKFLSNSIYRINFSWKRKRFPNIRFNSRSVSDTKRGSAKGCESGLQARARVAPKSAFHSALSLPAQSTPGGCQARLELHHVAKSNFVDRVRAPRDPLLHLLIRQEQ